MSTRCQIGIFEKPFIENGKLNNPHTLIYRHNDGYPEGILKPLTDFTKDFIKNRGFDAEYIGARLLCYLISEHTEDLPDQSRKDYKGDKVKASKFGGVLSYGICKSDDFHGDIEYFYAIFKDKIEIYKTSLWNDTKAENFKLIETIKIS